jgi:hypothetical protein
MQLAPIDLLSLHLALLGAADLPTCHEGLLLLGLWRQR